MTEKEIARELVDEFFTDGDKGLKKVETHINYECAKQCALICVDKIINGLKDVKAYIDGKLVEFELDITKWEKVIKEIKKL